MHLYWKNPLVQEVVAVQKLSVLQASGDAVPTGGLEDELPSDALSRETLIKAAYVNLIR